MQGELYKHIMCLLVECICMSWICLYHTQYSSLGLDLCVLDISSAHAVRLLVSVKHNEWDQCEEEATCIIYVDASRHQATLGLENLEVISC